MNTVTLCGRIHSQPEMILVRASGGETPLVKFMFVDSGLPYQKSSPMLIEVHFMKEAASHIYPYLRPGKSVVVNGFLRSKNFTTTRGDERYKYYISAEYIIFPTEKEDRKNGNENCDPAST